MKKIYVICLITLSVLKSALAGIPLITLSADLENFSDSGWINKQTIVKGSAFSGNSYSNVDSAHQFGFGYKSGFAENCQNKNLIVRISEQLRMNSAGKGFGMAATVAFGDSVIFWQFFNANVRVSTAGQWTKVTDEITIPRTLTGEGYVLTIFLFNDESKANVDLDDITLQFEEMQLPTFIPPSIKTKSKPERFDQKIDLKNISIWLNKKDGGMFLEDKSEDTIFSAVSLVTELLNKNKSSVVWQNKWTPIVDSAELANGIVKVVSTGDICRSVLSIDAGVEGKIKFSLASVFEKPAVVARHALAFNYKWELKEVYKNTFTETENFSSEYWLGKDGFKLSNGIKEMVLYHPDNVSSVQLHTVSGQFFVNADYSGDHPMLHFPLMEKSYNRFVDYSPSVYKANDTLKCEFVLYLSQSPVIVPTLLQSSHGFPSTFVWTEHADFTSMRTNRAVYFGSENIDRYDKAVGGFTKYSIPVTKSVFYSNPKPVDNSEKAGFLSGPEATIKETEGFRNFLKQLDETGNEICLHTPDHLTCDRKILDESLSNMKREFSSVSWIDHGYDNAVTSNREDLNCDGSDASSKYYAADLWEKYGVKYLWNSFYEDSGVYSGYSYNSFFPVPYAGFSDPFPGPVYWKNKTRTGNLIHWRTTNTLDFKDGSLWDYFYNDLRLNDAVNTRSTVIIHCYPARADSTTGFYDINDGVITANQKFNNALSKLSQYRSEGKIRLSTIREMLDHRTLLENLSYEFLNGGIVRIENKGSSAIYGVTFAVKAREVKSSKKDLRQKRLNNELIFWTDIEGGETIDFLLKY